MKRVAVGVLAIVALALALSWMRREDAARATPSTSIPSAQSAAARPIAAKPAVAMAPIALPPANVPMSQAIPVLHAAAIAGSAPAACRLAMEILRCRKYSTQASQLERLRKLRDKPDTPSDARPKLAEMVAKAEKDVSALAPVCDGAQAPVDVPWQLLLSAGQSGHVPSMAWFVMSDAVHGGIAWDPDALSAYRTFAFQFLTRAAAAGDSRAMEALGKEHMAQGTGTRAIPYDPVRGRAILVALQRAATPEYRGRLTIEIADATQMARLTTTQIQASDGLATTLLPPDFPRNAAGQVEMGSENPDGVFGCGN